MPKPNPNLVANAVVYGLFTSAGGVPKRAAARVAVTAQGLVGDAVKHTKIHGGPERAVCLFSAERLQALRAEGHPIEPGWIGENVLIAGLDWDFVVPGDILQLGSSVRLQMASYTEPCNQIAGAFSGGHFRRIKHEHHYGWSRLYARVLAGGDIAVGDAVIYG